MTILSNFCIMPVDHSLSDVSKNIFKPLIWMKNDLSKVNKIYLSNLHSLN